MSVGKTVENEPQNCSVDVHQNNLTHSHICGCGMVAQSGAKNSKQEFGDSFYDIKQCQAAL